MHDNFRSMFQIANISGPKNKFIKEKNASPNYVLISSEKYVAL